MDFSDDEEALYWENDWAEEEYVAPRPRGRGGMRVRGIPGMRGRMEMRHRRIAGLPRGQRFDGDVRHARVLMEDEDPNVLSYTKRLGADPGSAQYLTHPLSPEFKYFEIEILSWGVEGRIGLGLARKDYPLGNMPGWRSGSIGYHADDGRLFHESGGGEMFGPSCEAGDRMGCGVESLNGDAADSGSEEDEEDFSGRNLKVYFTRNGERVGHTVSVRTPPEGFFPMVAMHSDGEMIRVNLEVGAANPDAREVVMRRVKEPLDEDVPNWKRLVNVRQVGKELRYTDRNNSGLAQCELAVSPRWPYFELEITNQGQHCYVAIGVAHKNYPSGQHPGWKNGSVAYHADDGKLFNGCGQGEPFGPRCRKGDRMGCGICFRPRDLNIAGDWDPESSSDEDDDDDDDDDDGAGDEDDSSSEEESTEDRKVYVYFTRNDEKIGGCAAIVPRGGFFPTVGLMSFGEVVDVQVHARSG